MSIYCGILTDALVLSGNCELNRGHFNQNKKPDRFEEVAITSPSAAIAQVQ
jgi:hypothetical protein